MIKKFYLEKEFHEDIEVKYQELKPKLKELASKKDQICEMQKAIEEQDFHMKWYDD